MHVQAISTPIVRANDDLFKVIDHAVPELQENTVVVISSKICGLCEGRVVPAENSNKGELVRQEAEWFLPAEFSQYGLYLSIVGGQLIASAGIDESNGNGNFILWPSDPQATANAIWEHLHAKHARKNLGVILSDSRVTPLIWGVVGTSIAHCGFEALNVKIGHPDIFGRALKMTKVNVAQGIAGGAVLEMGEADEQTPIVLVNEIREIKFQDHVPTKSELADLRISIEDDFYSPLLTSVKWQKGQR